MKQNFIKTSDANTAEMLRNDHFTELPKQGDFFVFINDSTMKFSKQTEKQIIFTNTMNM